MIYSFWVEGRPKAKERPRRNGNRTYTPKATQDAEQSIADAYDGPIFDGPVAVEVEYFKNGQLITVETFVGEKSPLRGDIDNYVKTTLDGLQKSAAFADDKCVMSVAATKHVGNAA